MRNRIKFLRQILAHARHGAESKTWGRQAAEIAHTPYQDGSSLRQACPKLGYLRGEEFDAIARPEAMIHLVTMLSAPIRGSRSLVRRVNPATAQFNCVSSVSYVRPYRICPHPQDVSNSIQA